MKQFVIKTFIVFIFKSHPFQGIYFNLLAKNFVVGNLPIDYWGTGNKKTIDSLLQKNEGTFLNISTASYSDLNNIYFSSTKQTKYSKKISFNGTSKESRINADYIFTNYYYDRNPNHSEKYKIPSNFFSYYKLIIDGIIINELFKKK